MIDAISAGLFALLTPQAVLFLFLGVIYGLVIGILPGLGGVVAMALLLPFTYGFETAATLALLPWRSCDGQLRVRGVSEEDCKQCRRGQQKRR